MSAQPKSGPDQMTRAAREAAERAAAGAQVPEPSLGTRLGQIGVLGWAVIVPTLLALLLGRWLDRTFSTGVFFSAPLIMIGAGVGFWSVWKWMHRS